MKNSSRPMKTAGWWANITMPKRKSELTSIETSGATGCSCDARSTDDATISRRKIAVITTALTSTASAARQPKWVNMNAVSQLHLAATINTGGAANEVNVPPTDTLTKS